MLAFVEPGTADIPMAIAAAGGAVQDERLVVGSRLATSLAGAHSVEDVAALAVRQLHDSFDYYLAVVQRLDPDGSLRVRWPTSGSTAAATPTACAVRRSPAER